MNPIKQITQQLISLNIRPSFQRIKVLEYLIDHQTHPSADDIYKALVSTIPTLSKSTVYNTLELFIEKGLVKPLMIEENEALYDIILEQHGHFKCTSCGSIFNFDVSLTLPSDDTLLGFKIVDQNVCFKGICNKCLMNT